MYSLCNLLCVCSVVCNALSQVRVNLTYVLPMEALCQWDASIHLLDSVPLTAQVEEAAPMLFLEAWWIFSSALFMVDISHSQ